MATSHEGRLGTTPDESVKAPVVASTTANITLSGEQTIDSVAIVAGNRVLVKNQTDASENGVYDAKTGAWTRSTDWNTTDKVINGLLVLDTNNGGVEGVPRLYSAGFTGTFTLDSTDVTFTKHDAGTGDGSALTDKASVNQVADNALTYAASTTGNDTYVVTLPVDPGAWIAGQRLQFKPDTANTGDCTIDRNSAGAESIKLANGNDPHNGAIQANKPADVIFDGTNCILLNPFFTGMESLVTKAELDVLDGATIGTQVANKAIVADANVNTGISKITQLHIGASGSEVQVTKTAAQINDGAERSATNTFTKTQSWTKGAALTTADVTAGDLAIGSDGNYFEFTDTDTITSMTVAIGTPFWIRFTAAATLTHHATNLILPGGKDIVTVAGAIGTFFANAAGDVTCTSYEVGQKVLQRTAATPYATRTAITTPTIPFDDNVPLSTGGAQIFSESFTPKSATSTIVINVKGCGSANVVGTNIVMSLFESTTNLKSVGEREDGGDGLVGLNLEADVASSGISARTFTVRIGVDANTFQTNGITTGPARRYGGALAFTMTFTEYA